MLRPLFTWFIPTCGYYSDNDTVSYVSSISTSPSTPGPMGPQGPQGIQGEPGPMGPQGATGTCSCDPVTQTVDEDYTVEEDDYYIGVDCSKPVTIKLPRKAVEGRGVIVKAQMKPPLGNRKITIVVEDDGLIDGYTSKVIQTSNECVWVLYHAGEWRVI